MYILLEKEPNLKYDTGFNLFLVLGQAGWAYFSDARSILMLVT